MSWIRELRDRVLQGGEIAPEEALQMLGLQDKEEIRELLEAAHTLTRHFHTTEPSLCSLVNAKSYLCGEDCGFCSQSVRFDTQVDRYPLMAPEEVLSIAQAHERAGSKNFCLVTSGGALSESEFETVLETLRLLRRETGLQVDASLGFLSRERVVRLKEAGLRRYNNNLQTSREHYAKIVSTHTYDTRKKTLDSLQEHGMEICSGGILGMGETREDRVQLAFELKPYAPECLPINILNPRPGTPLEHQDRLTPEEILKTIAMFRFVHPRSNLKLAGGREANLSPADQERALCGGANGMIIGGYLTTGGNPLQRDFDLLERAGYGSAPQKPARPSACL